MSIIEILIWTWIISFSIGAHSLAINPKFTKDYHEKDFSFFDYSFFIGVLYVSVLITAPILAGVVIVTETWRYVLYYIKKRKLKRLIKKINDDDLRKKFKNELKNFKP